MNKIILLMLPILIFCCGCEISFDTDKRDRQVIEQCRADSGTAIIDYCRSSDEICSVQCVMEGKHD